MEQENKSKYCDAIGPIVSNRSAFRESQYRSIDIFRIVVSNSCNPRKRSRHYEVVFKSFRIFRDYYWRRKTACMRYYREIILSSEAHSIHRLYQSRTISRFDNYIKSDHSLQRGREVDQSHSRVYYLLSDISVGSDMPKVR